MICKLYNHKILLILFFPLDPLKSCNKIQSKPPGCSSDADCPSKYACFEDGNCRNACDEIKPCGKNAVCKVEDTLPVRTMVKFYLICKH